MLIFGEEVDDLVDIFDEFLFRDVEFFKDFAMDRHTDRKNQNIEHYYTCDDDGSEFCSSR